MLKIYFALLAPTSTAAQPSSLEVASRLFAPLDPALLKAAASRQCPEHPDLQWLMTGSLRCILTSTTGRDFIKRLAGWSAQLAIERSTFFGTLHSTRRLAMCAQVNAGFAAR